MKRNRGLRCVGVTVGVFCLFVLGFIYLFIYLFLSFCLFRAAPVAYGGSQARSRIGAVVAGLHRSHSNARFLTH